MKAHPLVVSIPNIACAVHVMAGMAKMIQIRNVPDDLHRTSKARAARAGMTLSGYLLAEIEQLAREADLERVDGAARS